MPDPNPTPQPHRLRSLDLLRGLILAAMIVVTNPGTYAHVYPQLRHAPWNNPTATDLIFPAFLVMVGLSLTLSLSARLRRGLAPRTLVLPILRRSLLLLLLGLLVNGFPLYHLATLRIPGILQRIGICYLLAALLYLATARLPRRTRQATILAAALASIAVYWALLTLYPTPGFGPGHLDPLANVAAVLDRAVFTQAHIFPWGVPTPGFGVTFDPEGILSTLGALATTLLGVLAGDHLRSPRTPTRLCAHIASAGTLLWLLSLALAPAMPLNKQIFTPTFALWSAGLSLLLFAALFYLVDIRHLRRGQTPALILGTNAILAFCLSQVITALFSLWRLPPGTGQPLYTVLAEHLYNPWLPPRPASLAWALTILLLNTALLYPLYRKQIFLRL